MVSVRRLADGMAPGRMQPRRCDGAGVVGGRAGLARHAHARGAVGGDRLVAAAHRPANLAWAVLGVEVPK